MISGVGGGLGFFLATSFFSIFFFYLLAEQVIFFSLLAQQVHNTLNEKTLNFYLIISCQ